MCNLHQFVGAMPTTFGGHVLVEQVASQSPSAAVFVGIRSSGPKLILLREMGWPRFSKETPAPQPHGVRTQQTEGTSTGRFLEGFNGVGQELDISIRDVVNRRDEDHSTGAFQLIERVTLLAHHLN